MTCKLLAVTMHYGGFQDVLFHTLPADIDECELMADVCQQNCTNTEGSFNCSCSSGFVLLSDGNSCAGELHAVVGLLYTTLH